MRPILTSLALLSLAACGPLVQIGGNAESPPSLLTVTPTVTVPATTAGAPVMVTTPHVPGKLQTLRVPVTTAASELKYLENASWIEQPARLFQHVLADHFEAATGQPAIDETNVDVLPSARLTGTLLDFGMDVSGSPEVVVRYDAVLTRGGVYVASRRFEARAPLPAQSGPYVAAALSDASNAVAADVAAWLSASLAGAG